MNKLVIKDLDKHYGEEIEISGFVDNIRDLQWVQFIVLRDHTGKVQITIEKSEEKNKKLVELVSNMSVESTIKVKGIINEAPKVKMGGKEIIPEDIIVTSENEGELPFNYKDLTTVNLDTRLDYRYIDLRSDKNILLFQVQSDLVKHMRDYLYDNGFYEIHTPKLIGAASESGSDVFEVKYFDTTAYLAQSPQFYKQMAMAAGMGKVFEVGPVFRAENSNTSRHATEFSGFDVEFSYIDSYEDVMDLEENMLTYALKNINDKYSDKIKELFDVDVVIPKKMPRMKLGEVYSELEKRYGYKVDESEKCDLTTEAERLCAKLSKDMFDSEFLFVVDYPADKRPFYHMRDKDGKLLGYDLIWKGVEITSGAQREHRYSELAKNCKEYGLGEDVKFYLDFFKHGCPPHGGFGLGIDRLTMLLLNIPSVKETQFLFRGPNRLNP